MPKVQSLKQWDYLNSPYSPLTEEQKQKMRKERDEGKITIKKPKKHPNE